MPVEAVQTEDHKEIQAWVEAREGKPGHVKNTDHGEQLQKLVVDFPGHSGEESVEEISWEEFFRIFDEAGLVFVYKEDTATGEKSYFCSIVDKENADAIE